MVTDTSLSFLGLIKPKLIFQEQVLCTYFIQSLVFEMKNVYNKLTVAHGHLSREKKYNENKALCVTSRKSQYTFILQTYKVTMPLLLYHVNY